MTEHNHHRKDQQENKRKEMFDSVKSAGVSVGEVIDEFTGRVRDDYRSTQPEGQASNAARESVRDVRGISSFDDAKKTGSKLWKRTTTVTRGLSDSVRRAAEATRESDAMTNAKDAVGQASDTTRGTVRDSVKSTLNRFRGQRGEMDDTPHDDRNETPGIIEGEVVDVDDNEPRT